MSTPLRSHHSQDSLDSPPSLTDSDASVLETDLLDDEASVRQGYVVPLATRPPTLSLPPSDSLTRSLSTSVRQRPAPLVDAVVACDINDTHGLGNACGLPDATDPFAGIGSQFNGVLAAPGMPLIVGH